MGSLSDAAENKFLNHLLGVTAWTTPATVYLALSTADPLDANSGAAEPAGDGYARTAISFGVAAGRVVTQDAIVTFPLATGTWGTLTHWILYDAATAGNALAHGALSASKTVISGNTPSVASGQVAITVSAGGCSDYLANAMLNHIFNSTSYSPPSVHVALCETAITDASTGVNIDELDMTGYAREAMTLGTTNWNTATTGSATNKTLIDFGALTGTGEVVEAICLVDNATTANGNLLVYDNTPSQAIGTGDTVQIPIGSFTVSLN
jgi:hypothetical protein